MQKNSHPQNIPYNGNVFFGRCRIDEKASRELCCFKIFKMRNSVNFFGSSEFIEFYYPINFLHTSFSRQRKSTELFAVKMFRRLYCLIIVKLRQIPPAQRNLSRRKTSRNRNSASSALLHTRERARARIREERAVFALNYLVISEIFISRSSCFRLCDCGTLFFQSQREKIFLSL